MDNNNKKKNTFSKMHLCCIGAAVLVIGLMVLSGTGILGARVGMFAPFLLPLVCLLKMLILIPLINSMTNKSGDNSESKSCH